MVLTGKYAVRAISQEIYVSCGGSLWESNLLGADSPSTYEEGPGLNWRDLPSFSILNAAFLPPRFFIPLFSSEEPFQRLDCWPPASRRAPLACICPLLCRTGTIWGTEITEKVVWHVVKQYAGQVGIDRR